MNSRAWPAPSRGCSANLGLTRTCGGRRGLVYSRHPARTSGARRAVCAPDALAEDLSYSGHVAKIQRSPKINPPQPHELPVALISNAPRKGCQQDALFAGNKWSSRRFTKSIVSERSFFLVTFRPS